MPRGTLVLMGSGETTPTMVTIHQRLLQTLRDRRGGSITAALLDTTYGFQENAAEITSKAQHYFSHHVGQEVAHLAAPRPSDLDPAAQERLLDAIRQQQWLFAGPGSPTYALQQWHDARIPAAMTEVVERGGVTILASAAAVTAGSHALRVYEVYKAGDDPAWAEGADLVGRLLGWDVAVVPHFDNAEGGTHDTRYCYMGERRLRLLEAALPDGAWVLGVDEHTACMLDLGTDTLRVAGRGGVHVRVQGTIRRTITAGEEIALADLAAIATADEPPPPVSVTGTVPPPGGAIAGEQPRTAGTPSDGPATLSDALAVERSRFDHALEDGDAEAATAAALATEQLIRDWSAETLQSADMDTAVVQLRAMITRLGRLAAASMHDHSALVRPHIETLLHVRDAARERKDYAEADHIRRHMTADGVIVKDTRDGVEWEWLEPEGLETGPAQSGAGG